MFKPKTFIQLNPVTVEKQDDFAEGDEVYYLPTHKLESPYAEDREYGVVSSTNDLYVHVKFYEPGTTSLRTNSQACSRRNLFKN